MSNVRSDTKIRGLEQALKELRKVEPELVKTFRKEARAIAAPSIKNAKDEFRWQASVSSSYQPDVPGGRRRNKPALTPLSGMGNKRPLIKGRPDTRWDATRALRGISFKLGGPAKKRRGNRAYRMFSIIQNNPAGAIYDMAGKKGGFTNPTKRFEESLEGVDKTHKTGGGKGPSRYMWPAVEGSIPDMQAKMLVLVRMIEQRTNRTIVQQR